MVVFIYIFDLLLNIILGFSLGALFFLYKNRKSQRETRRLMKEIDVLLDAQQKEYTEVGAREIDRKLTHIGGRLEVTGEFFK